MTPWSPLDLAPGLYGAAVALLLAAALRRWYDAVPWKVLAVFGGVLALLFGSCLLGGKVLLPLDNLRGQVPFQLLPPSEPLGNLEQGDLVELVLPSIAAARAAWVQGRWPLWISRVGAGMPLLADPQAQALSPVVLVALPFSPVRSAGLIAALRVYLALVFTFLLLRRQGLGTGPALAGALAFGLGGFLILWVGWPLASTAAMLPAVLYAVVRMAGAGWAAAVGRTPAPRGSARPDGFAGGPGSAAPEGLAVAVPGGPAAIRRRDSVLLAVCLAALLLGGHPETVLYACLLAAAFVLDLLRSRPSGARAALARRYLAAAFVAGGLAAPALLPALDYLPRTLRAERLAHPAAADPGAATPPAARSGERQAGEGPAAPDLPGGGAPAGASAGATAASEENAASGMAAGGRGVAGELARRWLPIAAPNAYGNSRFVSYWGVSNSNEDASGFAGTAALLGAVLAVVAGRRRRLPQEGLMIGVAAVCLALLAVPAAPASWQAALALHAPALAAVAASRRCLLLVAFAIAYLGACTFERWRRGELRRSPLLVVAAVLAGLLAWGYVAHPYPGDPQRLAILRFGWLRWQLRFLLGTTLLLALPGGTKRAAVRQGSPSPLAGSSPVVDDGAVDPVTRLVKALAMAGLAVMVAAELLLAHGVANPPMPMRLAFPGPPPLALLAGGGEGQRQAAWALASPETGGGGGDRMAALGRSLPPNLAGLYGLSDIRVYNPMAPAAYLAMLEPIVTGWWGEMPELGAPRKPLYARLGVRFLLVEPGRSLGPPWQRMLSDPAGWVYQRPDAWPRLYATAEPDGEPLPGRLRLLHFDDDDIAARALLDPPGARLEGSVYQDGAWRLLVDGRPTAAPPRPRGDLLGATLPGGDHRLDLLYRPRAFVAGLLLAALACAAALALWTPRPRPGQPRPGDSLAPEIE